MWNSLGVSLLPFQESELFLDCQLGYFHAYADWANLAVKDFLQTSNILCLYRWSLYPALVDTHDLFAA